MFGGCYNSEIFKETFSQAIKYAELTDSCISGGKNFSASGTGKRCQRYADLFILRHLIWVYTVNSDLSVLRVTTVLVNIKHMVVQKDKFYFRKTNIQYYHSYTKYWDTLPYLIDFPSHVL